MARIIENLSGRRTIKLSTNDIISIVQQYQTIITKSISYREVESILNDHIIFLPEDL